MRPGPTLDLDAFAAGPAARPAAATVRPRRPRPEDEVYYDDGFVMVTGDGLLIGERRYPLRFVTDVDRFHDVRVARRKSPLLTAGIVVGFVSAMLLFQVGSNLASEPGLSYVGACMLVLAVPSLILGVVCAVRAGKKVKEHAVVLIDHVGAEEEIWFRGKDRRDKVYAAVREALEARR
jgi:hypothetical protein